VSDPQAIRAAADRANTLVNEYDRLGSFTPEAVGLLEVLVPAARQLADLREAWDLLPERDRRNVMAVVNCTVPDGWTMEYGDINRDIVLRHVDLPHECKFFRWIDGHGEAGWRLDQFWTGEPDQFFTDPQAVVDRLTQSEYVQRRIAEARERPAAVRGTDPTGGQNEERVTQWSENKALHDFIDGAGGAR
jgi:hypothetical protein